MPSNWYWRRLLKVLWTSERSNQSILRETNPEYSLKGLMLTLKLQYFGANSWLIGKVPDAGKDWGLKGKRVSEDEMAKQHHQCNEHEVGQIPGHGEGQGGLVCCSPWCHKESDITGRLNNNWEDSGECWREKARGERQWGRGQPVWEKTHCSWS